MAKFSQLDISKHKGQVLDKIMSWKRQEVQRLLEDAPLEQLKALAAVTEPPAGLRRRAHRRSRR